MYLNSRYDSKVKKGSVKTKNVKVKKKQNRNDLFYVV